VAPLSLWIAFSAIILAILAGEMWQTSRKPHALSLKEAGAWSAVWVCFALAFGAFVWHRFGGAAGWEFFTAYVAEKSLSLDNLFVFLLVFRYFGVPPRSQPRILEWGVLGALLFRMALILAGTALLAHFHWVLEFFGVFLIFAAISFLRGGVATNPHASNGVLRWVSRVVPVTAELHGEQFIARVNGARRATPLLLALLSVEIADLIFAVDSIPAAFAITRNPFIIFSANACAVLGLRALYFLVAGWLPRLRYLEQGLGVLLLFLGAKMLAARWVNISIPFSLLGICGIISLTILFSLIGGKRPESAA
jgi:tellurite resistance protein TerC